MVFLSNDFNQRIPTHFLKGKVLVLEKETLSHFNKLRSKETDKEDLQILSYCNLLDASVVVSMS